MLHLVYEDSFVGRGVTHDMIGDKIGDGLLCLLMSWANKTNTDGIRA